ncbi:metalloregulator ArsR/SmtB family transcription factor [Pseudorhodoplanes sp.]|uniref:ArsR/SmtB family transcription factor n=1 Tax=Pseudorhodoplanes sp. TaxID=1934341 RepID=UPI002D7E6839|nr:metalloregulator ArsR/SmtB family transcription factor [Pseudorhodoplanes sp.]
MLPDRPRFPLDSGKPGLILNHMVYYQHDGLGATFSALSDPTRRAILARLAEQDRMSVSEIAKPFPVSLPAIMKHLDVLEDAKLIRRSKQGRVVSCELTAAPMEDAMLWLNRYAQFWSKQLDRLAAFVEEDSCPSPAQTPSPGQASPSNVVSMHRRRRSTPPGPTPKKS